MGSRETWLVRIKWAGKFGDWGLKTAMSLMSTWGTLKPRNKFALHACSCLDTRNYTCSWHFRIFFYNIWKIRNSWISLLLQRLFSNRWLKLSRTSSIIITRLLVAGDDVCLLPTFFFKYSNFFYTLKNIKHNWICKNYIVEQNVNHAIFVSSDSFLLMLKPGKSG